MSGGDKENHDASIDYPKKKLRGQLAPGTRPDPAKILSPTSSNSRLNPREPAAIPSSPAKSFIARPVSPAKQATATSLLTNMVEKARSTRAAATRKTTTSSTASSAVGGTAAARGRRGAAVAAPPPPARATGTRTARRISGFSESSDGSTSTVIRKTGIRGAAAKAAAPPPPAKKATVMSTIRKGVAGATTKRAVAAPAAPTATTRSGRVLRKRG